MTTQILILRHAEKPKDNDRTALSLRGQTRAAALAVYMPRIFGQLEYLFAARDSAESQRSRLTLTPLSLALGVPIDSTFENMNFDALAKHLLKDIVPLNVSVVVCWHHGTIPELAKRLGAKAVPDDWGDNVFDRVWRITFDGNAILLEKIRQRLMFGDSQD